MSKGYICKKHGQEMVTQSAKKILRVVRKCGACWDNFRKGNNQMCEEHTQKFSEWEGVQITHFRNSCDDCAAVAR